MITAAGRGIGSVLPLIEPAAEPQAGSLWSAWTHGWPHVAGFHTARGALAALLAFRGVSRVWLPAYCCTALAEGAAAGEIVWYGVDDRLAPDTAALAAGVRAGDAVVGVDYFGASPPPAFTALAVARPEVLWIEDRAQAMAPDGPAWGDAVLYSPRKLIGVPDGGLLVSRAPLPTPRGGPALAAADAQAARRDDPLGERPETWFPLFRAQEAELRVDDQAMSEVTRRGLESAELAPLAEARARNYAVLAERLAAFALWPDRPADFAPLAFPVRLSNVADAAGALARARIWCARHWAELPDGASDFAAARRLSETLLSLPCDHRYGQADMQRIAAALVAVGRPL